MKNKIIKWIEIIAGCMILVLLVGFVYLYVQHRIITIDPKTISDINGELGHQGEEMGYDWEQLPKGIRVHDQLIVTYRDMDDSFVSTCEFSNNGGEYSVSGEFIPIMFYFCEPKWPKDLAQDHGYERSNYTFTMKLNPVQFMQRFSEILVEP